MATLFQLDQCYCILHSIVSQKHSSDRTTVATPSQVTETQSSGEGGEDDQHSLPTVEELKTTRKNSSVAESSGHGGSGVASGGFRGSEDNRRERILKASRTMLDDDTGGNGDLVSKSSTMATMRDILKTVHFNLKRNKSSKS